MNKTKGISLIALIITIAIIIILAAITVTGVRDTISNATMAQFKSDLVNIRTAYDLYTNTDEDRDLPVEKDGSGYILYDRNIRPDSELDTAVAQGGDSNDALYILDMNKLGLSNTKRGLRKSGNDDIYLVAKKSHNIYYVQGIRDKNGTLYHSTLQANSVGAPREYISSSISANGVINKDQGTIEAWVSVGSTLRSGVADKYVFSTYGDERYTNTIALRHTRDNKWDAIVSTDYANVSEVSVDDNLSVGWHLFSLRWSSTEMALFIDGVKVGSVANPKLMAGVPEKFNIGIGPKLNMIDNGYVTSGDNSNFLNATYDTSDYTSAFGSLKIIGNKELQSTKFYPVDVNHMYQISGNFKSIGSAGLSYIYYGVAAYDEDKSFIYPYMSDHYLNTETELARDLNTGDSVVYLKSAMNWKKSSDSISQRYFVIYNYKNYPAYTYSRNVYAFSDADYSANTITLNSPYSGSAVPRGTKVADSWDGATYLYTVVGYTLVPNYWNNYLGTLAGTSPSNSPRYFRYGTKYIKLLLLANYSQNSTYSLQMDDLEIKDQTDTALDITAEDICISNITRTDADILSRYQTNNGYFSADANTTYRMKN